MDLHQVLQSVVDKHPEVEGVIFCDYEGESIDYAQHNGSQLDPYHLKVLGATSTTWLQWFGRSKSVPLDGLQLSIKVEHCRYLLECIQKGYHVIAQIPRYALPGPISRSLHEAATSLRTIL